MKKIYLSLLLSLVWFFATGQRGISLSGTNYNSGTTLYFGCGDPVTFTVSVWSSTATNGITINQVLEYPSGWTMLVCPSDPNCISFTTNYSSGGPIRIKYQDNANRESGTVTLNISRTPFDHVVSGPSLVCTTGSFTFSGSWWTGPVVWQSSNPAILSINSSTGIATKVGNGPVSIGATVNTLCGPKTTWKTVHSGAPTVQTIDVQTSMCNGYAQEVTATISGNATTKTWAVTSGNAGNAYLTDYGTGRCYFNSYINDCYGLQINMANTCGSSLDGTTICVDNCLSALKVFPNPAKDLVSIEVQDLSDSEQLPVKVEVYDGGNTTPVITLYPQELKKGGQLTNKNTLEINVSKLSRGVHYLVVYPGGSSKDQKPKKQQIILE